MINIWFKKGFIIFSINQEESMQYISSHFFQYRLYVDSIKIIKVLYKYVKYTK